MRKQTIRDNDCVMNHYKAFAATYATQHAVPGSVRRPAMPSSTRRDIEEEEDERARLASLPSPCGRQNIISDEELTTQHALLERVGNQSSAPPVVQTIEERVVLGKVSGVTWANGSCKPDRDRIIIDGQLLVVKFFGPFKQGSNPNYAPATKNALDLNYEECAYVDMNGKRRVFMRHGKLHGGEGGRRRCGYYDLEPIKDNV